MVFLNLLDVVEATTERVSRWRREFGEFKEPLEGDEVSWLSPYTNHLWAFRRLATCLDDAEWSERDLYLSEKKAIRYFINEWISDAFKYECCRTDRQSPGMVLTNLLKKIINYRDIDSRRESFDPDLQGEKYFSKHFIGLILYLKSLDKKYFFLCQVCISLQRRWRKYALFWNV